MPAHLSSPVSPAARRLRKARQLRFESQQDFANALNAAGLEVTKAAVSLWELGRRHPSRKARPIVARVLRVKVRELLPPA